MGGLKRCSVGGTARAAGRSRFRPRLSGFRPRLSGFRAALLAPLAVLAAAPVTAPAQAQPATSRPAAGEVSTAGPDSSPPAWNVRDIVTDRFLVHPPGLGWKPGGTDERRPLAETVADFATLLTGGKELLAAMAASSSDPRETAVLAELLAGEPSALELLAKAHFDTKALLRRGADGHRLRFHSRLPFHGDYAFGAGDRVAGWGDAGSRLVWPDLFRLVDRPPERENWQHALHTVSLAWAVAAGAGAALDHSGYGWWTIAPVGVSPGRMLAVKGGLDWGVSTDPREGPPDGALWRGRATGHVFSQLRRWALTGDAVLRAARTPRGVALSGRIENVRIVPLDAATLAPRAAEAGAWHAFDLDAAQADGTSRWNGLVALEAPPSGVTGPRPDTPHGDWSGAFYGPQTAEVAGQWRIWTDPPGGADELGNVGAAQWRRQVLAVGGFGAQIEEER